MMVVVSSRVVTVSNSIIKAQGTKDYYSFLPTVQETRPHPSKGLKENCIMDNLERKPEIAVVQFSIALIKRCFGNMRSSVVKGALLGSKYGQKTVYE